MIAAAVPDRIARLNSGPPLTTRQLEELIYQLEGAANVLDIVSDKIGETARTDRTSESGDVTMVVSEEAHRAWRFATEVMMAKVKAMSDAYHEARGLDPGAPTDKMLDAGAVLLMANDKAEIRDRVARTYEAMRLAAREEAR